jgi:hypothetical protein
MMRAGLMGGPGSGLLTCTAGVWQAVATSAAQIVNSSRPDMLGGCQCKNGTDAVMSSRK